MDFRTLERIEQLEQKQQRQDELLEKLTKGLELATETTLQQAELIASLQQQVDVLERMVRHGRRQG